MDLQLWTGREAVEIMNKVIVDEIMWALFDSNYKVLSDYLNPQYIRAKR